MQNAGQQYGQKGASSHQAAPFNGHSETPATGGSITSSLRQFRRKNEDKQSHSDTNTTSTPTETHVARIVPHSHYPRTTTECYQCSPQYPDYGIQQPVKYSEISEPSMQEHLSPSVIQKAKSKEYIEMCNVQQQHMKPTYEHLNGQQTYSDPSVHAHAQYLPKESQVHHGYKPESQYYPKEPQYSPQLPHQIPKHPQMAAQVRKYPTENDFLSKLRRIHPTMARSIMSDHHLQESQSSYQNINQNRMYPPQNQRYMNYPTGMQNSAYGHGYMPYSNYPASCSYNRPPQMTPRFPPVSPHERSISPRRGYPDNMGISMNYGGIPPQKISPNYPQYTAPEYAQHYQHRRAPQDFYQQHCRPTQYLPHQMPPPDMGEGRVTVSDSIKHYIENWADEETATEMNQIQNPLIAKEAMRGRDEQSTETVFMINASELQYLENELPLVSSENGVPVPVVSSESGQYIIESGVSLVNGSEMVRLVEKTGQVEIDHNGERVVNLHIMDTTKPACMLANKPNELNQRQPSENPYPLVEKPRVVVHQNTIITTGVPNHKMTKEAVEVTEDPVKIGTSLPIISDTLEDELTKTIIKECRKETADKNCSPINLDHFKDQEDSCQITSSENSLVEEIASIQELSDLSKHITSNDSQHINNAKTENIELEHQQKQTTSNLEVDDPHKHIDTLFKDTSETIMDQSINDKTEIKDNHILEEKSSNIKYCVTKKEIETATISADKLSTEKAVNYETEQQSISSDKTNDHIGQTSVHKELQTDNLPTNQKNFSTVGLDNNEVKKEMSETNQVIKNPNEPTDTKTVVRQGDNDANFTSDNQENSIDNKTKGIQDNYPNNNNNTVKDHITTNETGKYQDDSNKAANYQEARTNNISGESQAHIITNKIVKIPESVHSSENKDITSNHKNNVFSQSNVKIGKNSTKRSRRIFSVDDIINNIGKNLKHNNDSWSRRHSLQTTKEFVGKEILNTFKLKAKLNKDEDKSEDCEAEIKTDEKCDKKLSEKLLEAKGGDTNSTNSVTPETEGNTNVVQDLNDKIPVTVEKNEDAESLQSDTKQVVEDQIEDSPQTKMNCQVENTHLEEQEMLLISEEPIIATEEVILETDCIDIPENTEIHEDIQIDDVNNEAKIVTVAEPLEKQSGPSIIEETQHISDQVEESNDPVTQVESITMELKDNEVTVSKDPEIIVESTNQEINMETKDNEENMGSNDYKVTSETKDNEVDSTDQEVNVETKDHDINLESKDCLNPDQTEVQYRNVIRVEESSVLLEIAGELVEINVNNVNGKNIITVVPLSGTAVVDFNDNYETFDNSEETDPLKLDEVQVDAIDNSDNVNVVHESQGPAIVETTSEIIIGMDLSLEEEIKLDLDQPPILYTKAAKKSYDSDFHISSVTSSADVLDISKSNRYSTNDKISSSKDKTKTDKSRKKRNKPDSSNIVDLPKRLTSKPDKKALFRDLIAARNRKKNKQDSNKTEDEEFVPFKELVRARRLKKLKLQKMKNTDGLVDTTLKNDGTPRDGENILDEDRDENEVEKEQIIGETQTLHSILKNSSEDETKSSKAPEKEHPNNNNMNCEGKIEEKSYETKAVKLKRVSFSDISQEFEVPDEKPVSNCMQIVEKINLESKKNKLVDPRINKSNDLEKSIQTKKRLSIEEYNKRKRKVQNDHKIEQEDVKKVKLNRHHSAVETGNNPEKIKLHRPKSLDDISLIISNESTPSKRKVGVEYSPVKQNFDWEETQSPKMNLTLKEHDNKFSEFKGLIGDAKSNKPKVVIDVNDFNAKPTDSSEDEILQNYREQVESKLSTLNIQIPRVSNLERRVVDPFLKPETNTLINRFLKNEKLSPEEMERIRKIISYKRLVQQLKKIKSPDLSRPSVNPSCEVRKELVDKDTKRLLKKVPDKKKSRFRNLYSQSDTESKDDHRQKSTCGDYSVIQSNCLAGVVPKLIIKRKTDMPTPFVRLERLDLGLLDEKHSRYAV